VLQELRNERKAIASEHAALEAELKALPPNAAERRGQIVSRMDALESQDQRLRQSAVMQILDMSQAGLIKPTDQREWTEGFGAALGSARLGTGLRTPIGERVDMLKGAAAESAAAKVVPDATSPRPTVPDRAQAEADYAGQIPVRPRDGKVDPGTPATQTPLGQHLIDAQIVGQGKKAVISGGHNMDNFDAVLNQAGGVVVNKSAVAPGIYQIEYQLPGGKVQAKTVYDPVKYSDALMANMASEAAAKAIVQWGINGQAVQFIRVNEVTFRVPISTNGGQPQVPTAFPVDPKKVPQ
jgi:hypothetical protein